MGKIALILPTKEYQEQLIDYKNEFEAAGDILHGTAGLQKVDNFHKD